MTLFEILNAITNEKPELDFHNDEISSGYEPRVINRWISMCDMYIPMVNNINRHEIPKDVHYKYLSSVIPQRKQYFNYIKKEDKQITAVKRLICNYVECNMREVEDYLKRLSDDEVNDIIEAFSYGKDGKSRIEV